MSRKMTMEQLRKAMTPNAPTRESLAAEVRFAEERLARAAAKVAVADAEYDAAEDSLDAKRNALEAFKAANPDAQMEIF